VGEDAVAPHTGRGGWTWRTGSAGWMFQLLIGTLLGVNRAGDQLRLTPRLPKNWKNYKIHYRYHQTVYHIIITQFVGDAAEANQLFIDSQEKSPPPPSHVIVAAAPCITPASPQITKLRIRVSLMFSIQLRVRLKPPDGLVRRKMSGSTMRMPTRDVEADYWGW
jgi:hypothetical protein